MLRLITICVFASFALYSIFSLAFFGVFGSGVNVNVIKSLPDTAWSTTAARILYSLIMIFSYPLQTFPARASLVKLLESVVSSKGRSPLLLHVIATGCIIGFTWTIAAFKVPIDILFSLVGCTAGPVICHFLPAMFWLKLEEDKPMNKGKAACWALIAFGVVATIVPLTALIISLTRSL